MLNKIFHFLRKEATPPLVSNIDTAIRDGGDLLCEADIIITEPVSANVFCGGCVTLGPGATLTGNLVAMACFIEGSVTGNVAVASKAELKSVAKIKGDIHAPVLNIEEGAVINGRIVVNEEVTAIRVELINKMKRAAEQALLIKKVKPTHTEVKQTHSSLRAAEKREPALKVEEKPQVKTPSQKELSAATQQPKATDNPEVNNRWW